VSFVLGALLDEANSTAVGHSKHSELTAENVDQLSDDEVTLLLSRMLAEAETVE